MEYFIRELKSSEYPLLKEFLYHAIFQRDPNNLIPRSVLDEPSISIYIQDFGIYKEDYCLCAERESQVVGAVWVRNIEGFGSIDDHTPEFAISLQPEYRGFGIGTALMRAMIEKLKESGYAQTSLAVQKDNYAVKMYSQVGFEIIDENQEEYIMICKL
ncbi:N-acetyltransferase [Enterococcus avium]|uniref:GNAT family N-acetyltransferase n=1 Tax=Enterococcus malodoratus TaxID=71451 RepID=UPI0008CA761E|nr:GNAT family N-acetyltransferase [Enterococcus malodoratus]BBM17833.1 N-acetyltransferase [Enterococcus avium]SET39877.1 Acetyltransferase (GNAT) family protein [Enterococcus malodoratus]